MKIVTYNIRYGLGLDNQYDLERIADSVRGADIIGLQEVERHWRRSGMVDQPEVLAKLLADYYWCYCPSFDVDASERDEDNRIINRRRQFGTMLLSKWPILSTRRIPFPQLGTINMFNMAIGALEGIVDSPLGALQIYSIHLSSISTRERLPQIETLLSSRAEIKQARGVWSIQGEYSNPSEAENFVACDWSNGDKPPPAPELTMIMGDFNSTEDSEEYRRFAGESDPIYGRGMHSDDLVDTWSVAKNQIGEPLSWWPDPPGRLPDKPLRLDYCFVSAELSTKVLKAWVDTDNEGSDHRPYWVELED